MRVPLKRPTWANDRNNRYFGLLFDASALLRLSKEHRKAFYNVYREAKRRRSNGEKIQVDHIVPITHPYVCGLNVPWNLRIISKDLNIKKSNRYWPDMPGENIEMFCKESITPHGLRLDL